MHLVFLAFRTFPFWAVPLALVFLQLGIHFMRRGDRVRHLFWVITGGIFVLAIAWIVFRGDLHSDAWVRLIFSLS